MTIVFQPLGLLLLSLTNAASRAAVAIVPEALVTIVALTLRSGRNESPNSSTSIVEGAVATSIARANFARLPPDTIARPARGRMTTRDGEVTLAPEETRLPGNTTSSVSGDVIS